MTDQEVRIRTLERCNQRLQERLNRIGKLVPGRQRVNELYRQAAELGYEADVVVAEYNLDDDGPKASVDSRLAIRREKALRVEALFDRRLAHDLSELRDAVRGDQRMPGSRSDPTMWRGERP